MLKKLILSAACAMLLLTGCKSGVNVAEFDVSTLVIGKDGSITEVIIDSFEQDYYSKSELEAYIDAQTAEYNRENPSSSDKDGALSIKVNQVLVEGTQARVELTYEDADDYEAFNLTRLELTAGDDLPGEAMMISYCDVQGESLNYGSLENLEKYKAVILHTSMDVVVDGKIAYVSENVTVNGNSTATCEGTLSVIIYK